MLMLIFVRPRQSHSVYPMVRFGNEAGALYPIMMLESSAYFFN